MTDDSAPRWDIRGWQRLIVHDDPPLVAARNEFLNWAVEMPEAARADIGARLRSSIDHAHLSARLELFVHHYLTASGWAVEIHPELVETTNRPDFRATKSDTFMLVECRCVFDENPVAQQDQRLRQLADEASRKMGRVIMLHPLSDLPPSVPSQRIRRWVDDLRIPDDSSSLLEFDFWHDHEGHHYGVKAVVLPMDDQGEGLAGVHGLMTQARTVTVPSQLNAALKEKSRKYGQTDLPYIIAVSGETQFPMRTDHEVEALFASRVWNVSVSGPRSVTETFRLDGFFTRFHQSIAENANVSAVFVYRFKWLEDGHQHLMHIYHNPYAERPVDPSLFLGVPQFVKTNEDKMTWINGEPARH